MLKYYYLENEAVTKIFPILMRKRDSFLFRTWMKTNYRIIELGLQSWSIRRYNKAIPLFQNFTIKETEKSKATRHAKTRSQPWNSQTRCRNLKVSNRMYVYICIRQSISIIKHIVFYKYVNNEWFFNIYKEIFVRPYKACLTHDMPLFAKAMQASICSVTKQLKVLLYS